MTNDKDWSDESCAAVGRPIIDFVLSGRKETEFTIIGHPVSLTKTEAPTERHFDIAVHVRTAERSLPDCSKILTRSNLMDLLKDAGLHIVSYGTSDITSEAVDL